VAVFVKLEGGAPLGQQVYQAFRRAILAGLLPPATRLPSTRALGLELGVSRNVVLLAYEQLLAEGYAEGRPGSGTYVAAALPESPRAARPRRGTVRAAHAGRLSRYGRRLAEIPPATPTWSLEPRLPYDFRYGVPSMEDFPHTVWRGIVSRRMRAGSQEGMAYGPPEGHAPLRQALAAYLRRARGVVCDADQILIVNGSQQALDLAARVLLDPGDHVVIEDPQYQGARRVFAAAGATAVPVPVDADGLDPARIPGRSPAARLAYVTPSHQFPTGVVMSLARRLALLEWAERAGAYIVEDDYDGEYRYEGRPIEAVQGLDPGGRVIYMGTFSKVLFPALRLGYLVLPPPLVAPFTAAKWLTDRHTATLEQEVLAEFIAEGHFERHLRRARTRNASRRKVLLASLAEHLGDRAEIMGANAGMHLMVWLGHVPPRSLGRVIAAAADAGVGVYPVAPYYIEPPRRAGLIVGYASLTEGEIRTGIGRLGSIVRSEWARGGARSDTVSS
jgi:GntR family transcriptional regulator/MocR family aminotransferase